MSTPVVLVSPAMAIGSHFYGRVVEAFESRGWAARALPRRGFERDGQRASRRHDWSYADEIADTAEAVAKARAEFPGRPVLLFGHSLGGHIAVGHQLAHDPADGVVLIGASLPHFRYYPHAGVGLLTMGALVPLVSAIRGYVPPPLFGAPGARTLMREWAHVARTGGAPFPVPRRIDTPTLAIDLEGDRYAVPAASRHFERTLVDPSALTRWDYRQDAVPEGGTTHHVFWAKTPDPVVEQVISWWTDVSR